MVRNKRFLGRWPLDNLLLLMLGLESSLLLVFLLLLLSKLILTGRILWPLRYSLLKILLLYVFTLCYGF
jgi:hypothetical protein